MCSEFRVASVLWTFLVVPLVGLLYIVVAFPGHTRLSVGFLVASQAKHFYELDIRFMMNRNTGRFETFYSCSLALSSDARTTHLCFSIV